MFARFSLPRLLLALLLASLLPLAQAAELRILLADTNQMPLARFDPPGQLKAGLLFDIGNMLAGQLRANARFIAMPRKRLAQTLINGDADLICNQQAQWLAGPFGWSTPFIPHRELVVTDARQPQPRSFNDLRQQPIGTILGFNYAELQDQLGPDFYRDDSLSVQSNLRKMAAGRVHHAIIDLYVLEYLKRQGEMPLAVHPYLVISSAQAGCAVAPHGRVTLAEVNAAITALDKRGAFKPLFSRYGLKDSMQK